MSQSSLLVITKQAIYNLLLVSQSTGTLAVSSIGLTELNETNIYPYIGINIHHRKEEVNQGFTRWSTMTFALNLSCKSTSFLQDAVTQRDLLLDAGDGTNGLEPILRNMAYNLQLSTGQYLLSKVEISDVLFSTSIDSTHKQAPSQFYAEAIILFKCWALIPH